MLELVSDAAPISYEIGDEIVIWSDCTSDEIISSSAALLIVADEQAILLADIGVLTSVADC